MACTSTYTDMHAHTMRCKLQSQCWTQGRCCGTASVSVRQQEQALRHRASRQVQPVVARVTTRTLRHMHRHIQTHTHTTCAMSFRHRASRQMQRAQCTRTMETGRARPRLVSTHNRTRMCNAVDEATTTCQQPHQRRDALLLPFARRTRQKRT